MRRELCNLVSLFRHKWLQIRPDIRLEGGAALEDTSSSASLPRLRPPEGAPRLAADMLGCNGELVEVSDMLQFDVPSYSEHYLMWDVRCLVGLLFGWMFL